MSITQDNEEVKQECEVGECHDPVFRGTLCWFHFCEEVVDDWAAEEPEEEEYIFGDHTIDDAWWGYDPKEVLA